MNKLSPNNRRPALLLLLAIVAAALAGPRARGLLAASGLLAGGALAIALPVGVVLALLIHKTHGPGRRLATTLLVAMLFIPLHLHAAAWRAGFGALGWFTQWGDPSGPIDPLLDGFAGAVWVHGTAAVPWVALIVGAALRGVDRRLEEQALLFMSPPGVLLRVSLRAAAPAVLVAAGWVLVVAATEMTASDLFQVRTFAEEVYTQHALGLFDPIEEVTPEAQMHALQLAMGLLAILLTAVAVLWGAGDLIASASSSRSQDAWRWQPGAARFAVSGLLCLLLVLIAAVPMGSLIEKAGGRAVREGDTWRREWSPVKAVSETALAPVRHRREFWQSLKLGVGVATGAVLLGGAIAWQLVPGGMARRAWLVLLAVCLATPGPLVGLAAIKLLNQPADSLLGFLGWLYDHTLLAPWLVQMVRATPIAALVLWPVWASVPRGVLEAARLDGVRSGWRLGLLAARIRPAGVAAAWLAALAVSFGELSATLLVMPPGVQTVTLQLFNLLHSGVDDRVAAISLVMILVLATLAWGIGRLWARDPTR
jgi:iron(III) transport system permease protein